MDEHRPHEERFVRHAGTPRTGEATSFPLRRAFSCAWAGLRWAFTSQRNLKIHLAFACAAIILGLILGISQAGWLAVILCIMLVMSLEVLNTAVESVVDLVSPEWNELAKHAKDCAAATVYLAAFGSLAVAAVVYLPPLFALVA